MKIAEKLMQLKGQAVAIWCARYTYRGLLAEVGDDFVVLTNPRAVEVTGASNNSVPNTEDPIPSDLIISILAIEQICQPAWVYHQLGEKKA